MLKVAQGVSMDLLFFEATLWCIAVGDHACIVTLNYHWPIWDRKTTLSSCPKDEVNHDTPKDFSTVVVGVWRPFSNGALASKLGNATVNVKGS